MENAHLDPLLVDPVIDEDTIIKDALHALEKHILNTKDIDNPNVVEYRQSLERVCMNRYGKYSISTWDTFEHMLAARRGRSISQSGFTCGWCKERIIGEDMQKHINRCAKVSPEHPANMVKALRRIISEE